LLALGRVSHLPTLWSNCLAGWWLAGWGNARGLPVLCIAVSLLYLGGAFLNDAFDADYDREFRRTRPIPAGAVSPEAAWRWGLVWLVLGEAGLLWLGRLPAGLGLALIACMLLYNTLHRLITFSPVLLGCCRFLIYVIAAATTAEGVNGWALWCGIALGVYVTGVGFIARWKNVRDSLAYWPLLLLALPGMLAMLMDTGRYRQDGLLLLAVQALWTLRCLRQTLWSAERRVEVTVSGLVAGIALVDWLAAVDASRPLAGAFIGCFLLTLALQRFRLTA
jgi:hypothetical protein